MGTSKDKNFKSWCERRDLCKYCLAFLTLYVYISNVIVSITFIIKVNASVYELIPGEIHLLF